MKTRTRNCYCSQCHESHAFHLRGSVLTTAVKGGPKGCTKVLYLTGE